MKQSDSGRRGRARDFPGEPRTDNNARTHMRRPIYRALCSKPTENLLVLPLDEGHNVVSSEKWQQR